MHGVSSIVEGGAGCTTHAGGAQSASGVRGVHFRNDLRKPWVAVVTHNGKAVRVGSFNSVEEAEAAVIAKRNELFTHNDLDR